MRIDKFLKVSRLIKRRTVANDACEAQKIFANGKAVKPSYQVKKGDILEIKFVNSSVKVRVTDISDNVKKGDASSLYEIVE
ncbi:MAG TPA: RNA-binding S4 domain-containing protein [Clostridia bacterium]|jgi:ribosomal 50S subunit-recycling heat shock protein|nr:MAG: ribosome-associated heat shock protein Hsp15 [Firmicutes bacterium ADurb.Bin099]HHT95936.1 RNA-binding S4 domain-containing protein [Clostridiaceae bacterium]HNZ41025.1 RNA-binding S4 domain-containing protein [Clostridia bacterium]HOF26340.1 RNA-binding S4 domain-containing protein [Clostridia bacterium]HOM34254.1 RNA-binding S4 domain-containing protein [Clostridia bacterium]